MTKVLGWLGLCASVSLGACLVSGGDGKPSSLIGGTGTGGAYGTAGTRGSAGGGAAGGPPTRPDVLDAGTAEAGAGDGGVNACDPSATGSFSLAWTVAAGDGGADGCDAIGGKTVDVSVTNNVSGAQSSTTVACSALGVKTCPLARGSYGLSLTLRDAAGKSLSQLIIPELLLETGEAAKVGALPFEAAGASTMARGFALTWSIADAATGAARTCAQAGAATLRLEAGTKSFDLPCAPGSGRTPSLAPGEYPVKLSLLDAAGAPLSVTGTMILRVEAGQLIFLGNAIFDV